MEQVELIVNEATILLVAQILKQERKLADFPTDNEIRVSLTGAIEALERRAEDARKMQ